MPPSSSEDTPLEGLLIRQRAASPPNPKLRLTPTAAEQSMLLRLKTRYARATNPERAAMMRRLPEDD